MFDIIDLNELQQIASYYKKRFKLKTVIDIAHYGNGRFGGQDCLFYFNFNYILYRSARVMTLYYSLDDKETRERLSTNSLKEYSIGVLLHELAHAINFEHNNKQYLDQIKKINPYLYSTNIEYHHNCPIEREADKFARTEIKKWRD